MMLYRVVLGNVHFFLHTVDEIPTLTSFSKEHLTIMPEDTAQVPSGAHRVDARIIRTHIMPELPGAFIGRRRSADCCTDGHLRYAALSSASARCGVTAVYTPDFSDMRIYIEEDRFPGALCPAEELFGLLPMSEMLSYFGNVLLHASRILVGGKAILFSAPSGTGKTTAARLWEKYGGARIIGNDRTLLSRTDAGFLTGGYVIDGTEPVCSTETAPAGAVILLSQGAENVIIKPSPMNAVRFLLSQTPADLWDAKQMSRISMLWMDLIERIPVYDYACRPDETAVWGLRKRLHEDGVL